ncbi:hypothetical protein [Sporosarcina sp. FSL K6-3457]|uniref:hypothetical protein n=1 Tax=Sporosarcina sp. FSL K6-3457 TaxID=2978204 RepID=UPI0030F4BF82
MAKVNVIDDRTLKIELSLEDAISMVQQAAGEVDKFASEIITIFEKMPKFNYTHYCFYAFDDTAQLFENVLGIDPKQYKTFSLDAPDAFFYSLYGGMASLYGEAKKYVA